MSTRDKIQAEALKALSSVPRGTVAMSMGSGKTRIGIMHMKERYWKDAQFLVVAPKKAIMQSWRDELVKCNLEEMLDNITFSTYRSLTKQDLHYDVIYLDECHSLLYSHEPYLSQYKGRIIGLTGTPPRYQYSEKGRMVNKYCPVVYTYTTDEAISDSILNDYKIVIHMIELNKKREMEVISKGRKPWMTSEEKSYEYWTERVQMAYPGKELQAMRIMRMKAMMTFPSKEIYAKKLLKTIPEKVILFSNTKEQADSFKIPSYHSSNKESESNLEKFKTGDIMQLACVHQLSEGVNIPKLKYGIILHAYGNERKAAQRLGRLLRLNPDESSTAHVLCYKDTVDETWVNNALKGFDQDKISKVFIS